MIVCVVSVNFEDEIMLKGEECKTWVNLKFFEKKKKKNGKLPIQYKLQA